MWGKKEPELPPRHPLASYLDQTQAKKHARTLTTMFCLSKFLRFSFSPCRTVCIACMPAFLPVPVFVNRGLSFSLNTCVRTARPAQGSHLQRRLGRQDFFLGSEGWETPVINHPALALHSPFLDLILALVSP